MLMIRNRAARFFVFSVTAAAIVVACGNNDEGKPNGVNDVKAACEIRKAWPRKAAEKCGNCVAGAPLAPCGCEAFKDFEAVCLKQGDARRAEATCSDALKKCEVDCGEDCNCLDHCFDPVPDCRRVTAARDGCVAEQCDPFCR